MIKCKLCGDIIFLPKTATFVEKEVYIPNFQSKSVEDGEMKKDFWMVKNMYEFANIGFSHNVKGSAKGATSTVTPIMPSSSDSSSSATPSSDGRVLPDHVRFLTCAACEQGPVGISLSGTEFLVEAHRVSYD
ncbi:putative Mss4 protein [Monocercomonoides exilis]|uniref:putative Mss4 protein n=1 Tax=Monocercomonoides exilis TaxID=2049356 RepID=UPI003559F76B|nr:putative Mss4 protein [Monocercomonoides exilis]|eukprot:MONOS_10477.1-p1 / transcript=MONOS_10477.1 / gene=MONOS_10477 / organism=Monocercomonoides_exilis_PA203 / gene_product=unspecified product / transcript_product=unspecified product / location=Mono_scaffold00478:23289-23742(-) / protein_length=131 / sequence_SO=supercontig / SO=protein_coding / is_pseudo=false